MQRRKFITLAGGAAAAWPLAVGAQQAALPVVAYIRGAAPGSEPDYTAAFVAGLSRATMA